MAPESTIPCTPKTTLRTPIHMFALYSVNTYPVLCSDPDCAQLCKRGQSGGCSPHSYGEPCLYGAAVCVWLWRPTQPKHGHDLHPETGRNLQRHQRPTVLIGDRSPDLWTSRFSSNDRTWQKEVIRPVGIETKYRVLVGNEEFNFPLWGCQVYKLSVSLNLYTSSILN